MSNKITEDQLKTLQEHNNKLGACLHDVGVLENQKNKVLELYNENLKKFDIFKDELTKEYGNINIEISTGEYKPIENDERKEGL
tara:strand:+ start:65 stop:316 length:252 start_codon:yes stop_codon:yes gene_type:complete